MGTMCVSQRHRRFAHRRHCLALQAQVGIADRRTARAVIAAHVGHTRKTKEKDGTVRNTEHGPARQTRERVDSSCVFHGVLHAVA
jgi:hypothetical protein